jgi:Domain of Unknown Function (DUF1080)
MKFLPLLLSIVLPLAATAADDSGFVPLFNGKDLADWKTSEKPGTFSVENGVLIVNGDRSHLFYNGPVQNHDFKNFHLRVELQTFPSANSGVYFHTEFQETGWPSKGFETQVNNTHKDPKKTAGLYDVKDNFTAPVEDNKWFVMEVIVEGKHVVTKVDGKVITDFTEADPVAPSAKHPERVISHGTFAIQGHDPGSRVEYRKIEVRPLP